KGGAAQKVRTRYATDQANRQMYTCVGSSGFCSPGSLLSASPFDVSNTNITVTGADTFTYVLPALPPANVARLVTPAGTPHNLVSGDLVDVTLANPTQYNVTGASITRLNATDLEYTMSGSSTSASTGHVVVGKKLATSVSGVGTAARATVPNHGYATGNLITISGANEAAF